MFELKRRKGESFETLVRRFRKQAQMSGRVLQAKKIQFHKKKKSKNLERASTLLRLRRKSKIEYLTKIGATIPKTKKEARKAKK